MSEDKLYAEGTGPGAGNVALCRLADVVGHCMKGQPLMSALRQVTETLRANEDLQMYLDCSPGDFARMITEDYVVWRGRPAEPAKRELIRRGKLGITEEKWIPGVKAVPDLKGVSGTLELLNKLQVPSNGLKALASGFVGRLALRESDAVALFGYGQLPSSCDEPARASGSIEGHAPSANAVRLELVPNAAELAARAKEAARAALKTPPEDYKARCAWAAAREADLKAAGVPSVRQEIADACQVTVRAIGNWIAKANAAIAEEKKEQAIAASIKALTGGRS